MLCSSLIKPGTNVSQETAKHTFPSQLWSPPVNAVKSLREALNIVGQNWRGSQQVIH